MGDFMALRVGDIIKCRVVGIQTYGVFVEARGEYTGLIHISEISDKYISNITDYITINEIIFAKILEIDNNTKQLKLTIKNLDYRGKTKKTKVNESPNGFNELKRMMPQYIDMKLKEYKTKHKI